MINLERKKKLEYINRLERRCINKYGEHQKFTKREKQELLQVPLKILKSEIGEEEFVYTK